MRTTPRLQPSTFSIVAADPEADEVGAAVHSKFLAAGAVVPWARGATGAVATQAFADVMLGPLGLEAMGGGAAPQDVLDSLLADDEKREQRQVGIVDASGRSATFTGAECFEWAGGVTGNGFACQGNILAGESVVTAMAETFQSTDGPLADRMIAALQAAQREGGDRRGQEAAGLYVAKPGGGYGGNNDRYIDLRVDHHAEPIEQLGRLLDLHRLYFQRPAEDDLIAADQEIEAELRELLGGLGKLEDGADLWEALSDYMGWENLEERWAGPGRIDPKVLGYLRAHSERGAPPDPADLRL